MKISHKLCVRMDGSQFSLSWGFTVKIEHGNHKWAWVYIAYKLSNVVLTTWNFHNPSDTIVNWNFGFLLILDVRNVLNICSAENPCEVNAGDCSLDNECRGNLICSRSNCEGPRLSLYAKCCQEPGEDMFYISIWLGNYWWIFSLLILIIHISKKKPLKVSWIFYTKKAPQNLFLPPCQQTSAFGHPHPPQLFAELV
jgi:hypothetical protein